MNDRIYANSSLQMNRIKYIGFDMDATLAIYKSPECERLAFDLAKQRLVDIGYPSELLYLKYNTTFPTRAVWFDKVYGFLLKTDINSNILGAWHGTKKIPSQEVRELYPNKHIQYDEQRIFILNTVFNTPEVYLLASLIDILNNSKKYRKCENRKGYAVDSRIVCFETIFKDCRSTIDWIHSEGKYKSTIASDIGKYIEKDERARKMMKHLSAGGKKIFLLTNSDYNYTELLMKYVMGPDWISLFDVVIVDGAKPRWFTGNDSFKVVDRTTGKVEIGSHNGVLEKGKVYSGGNVCTFRDIVGLRGKDTLYVGDHIFGDVLKSKRVGGWRTLLVIPELNTEMKHIEQQKLNIQKLLHFNSDVMASSAGGRSPNANNQANLNNIQKLTHEVESVYGSMGSLLRTGWKTTHFAENTRRYADLYTSCSYNLLYYSMHHAFSSPVPLMPHEIDIFTKKDDSCLPLLHAPVSVDETSERKGI